MKLSESEFRALEILQENEGAVLVTQVPEKNDKDLYGWVLPGLNVYKKLDKKGLVIITEEEPIVFDDGEEFTFTPMIELTDEGKLALTRCQS